MVAALGPDAGSTSGFTWPDRYLTDPEVALCIGLSGTHVLFWNPFASGWFCDRVDSEDHMLDQAHQLIEGAVVPRPDGVVAAARLQYLVRLDELPLRAAETVVPAGTRLTPAQQVAVDRGALTEDVARRLAVYAAEEATLART
ncbi:hypothetical protein SBI_01242 [Streptomyces bingchenggensis BCW-1]|uniref:Uncharacterized protein n=1 Tax=Streptomyces bingchenggensis (strain BCW-1) TaxID=749414 RepID=D7CA35_STRBB|nr:MULTISPECIES: hypothetical protein [Streptomyces]ADI04363.1 hypothetical protein SBI_01242 [Streptomyces bingchenggensis BCW-1]